MEISVTTAMLLLLAVMTVCLLIMMLSAGNPHKKHISASGRGGQNVTPSPRIYTETAFMIQKIDSRRRIMDEYRHTSIEAEHYELVFELENGGILHLSCSKAAYMEIPFQEAGSVTYCNGKLIKFESKEMAIREYIAV